MWGIKHLLNQESRLIVPNCFVKAKLRFNNKNNIKWFCLVVAIANIFFIFFKAIANIKTHSSTSPEKRKWPILWKSVLFNISFQYKWLSWRIICGKWDWDSPGMWRGSAQMYKCRGMKCWLWMISGVVEIDQKSKYWRQLVIR